MKKLLFITIIFLYALPAFATNIEVSGTISTDTAWSADTVKVTGTVTVSNGVTLTIDPGVYVEFQGHYSLMIYGNLLAVGTETDTIIFTINDTTGFSDTGSTDGGWHGIRLNEPPNTNDPSKITYCKIQYSKAIGSGDDAIGGGIYIDRVIHDHAYENYTTISNCHITNCLAIESGGGILCAYSRVKFFNNLIENCKANSNYGGGMYVRYDTLYTEISSNIIRNNTAKYGGGIALANVNPHTFVNNLIIDNHGTYHTGGLLLMDGSSPDIVNCTIANNSADVHGGGVNFMNRADPNVYSTVIWGNTAPSGSNVYIGNNDSDPNIYRSDIQGGTAGFAGDGAGANYTGDYASNKNSDPLFVGMGEHPYNILENSPCKDAGKPDTSGLNLPEKDLAGGDRVYSNSQNAWIDIGAYEYQKNPRLAIILFPKDDNKAVNIHSNLQIEFDQNVYAQSGNITIYNSGGSVFDQISANSTIVDYDEVIIPHNNDFVVGNDYYIKIDNAAFDDNYGNYYTGIDDDISWNFTVTAPDDSSGNCLEFDGSDDYIRLNRETIYNNGTGNAYTVCMWVKGSAQNDMRVFAEGRSSSNNPLFTLGTGTTDTDKFRVYIRDDANAIRLNAESAGSVFDNTWHHIAWVDDNGTATLYIDGNADATNFSYTRGTLTLDCTAIGAVLRSSPSNFFAGRIEEVQLWSNARTQQEIRENIYKTLDGTEENLSAYWQFNESSTSTAGEYVGGFNGALTDMETISAWVESNIPIGGGETNTQIVSSPGTINLAGTNISMNFTSKTDTDTFTVTKITRTPNAEPSDVDAVFNSQYWVVNKFGNGNFTTDITFTLSEDLTAEDQANPKRIELYTRNSNSDSDWSFLAQSDNVNPTNNSAKFVNIESFSQFLLARNDNPPEDESGTALDFDGSMDNVTGTGISTDITQFTIEAWVYHRSLPSSIQRYVTISPEYAALRHDGSDQAGQLHFYIKTDTGFSNIRVNSSLTADEWYHVAGTWDGTNLKLYLNGDLIGHILPSGIPITPDGNFRFSSSVETMDGYMDEIRFWNVARSEQELRENMYKTLSGRESGLVSYWQLNTGSGATAMDNISNNNATLNNMTDEDWVESTIPLAGGQSNSVTNFTSGNSGNLSNVTLQTSNDFDNPVDITITEMDNAPNILPSGGGLFVLSDRYWVINLFGNGGLYMVDLTFTLPYGYLNEYDTELKLFRRNSNSDSDDWIEVGTLSDVTPSTVTFSGITAFSQFTIGTTGDSPLPVELADFYAEIVKEGILLHWSTASEIHNAGFYVYRATGDLPSFQNLASLIEGAGTTNEPHNYTYLDTNVQNGTLYRYKLSDINSETGMETFHPEIAVIAGKGMVDADRPVPTKYALKQNYPNPFNPETMIEFEIPQTSKVLETFEVYIGIYDATGKLIKTLIDREMEAGYHSVIWDGKDDSGKSVNSGVYFYKMTTEGYSQTRRCVMLK